ncbi:hypothetical protein PK98_02290 [Croceibacterium mercuriale]|uniref:Lipoprotein n=1 Tax=Croceibacterium mercuriale TaxID=1572751 RepID=A0A0B2C0K8_9SPHN|nr:DUF6491 family protein [Croceibacterium mercuriale]KHL25531.1 hypothetical protein PK98_02290 [Croceibacterium mercuriale]
MRMFILLAAAVLLPSCTDQAVNTATNAAAGEARECFFGSRISGFKDDGQDRVLVRIGFREAYELTLAAGCPPVNLATSIGIVSRGGDRICTGRPAELVVPRASGTGSQRCLVSNVRKLSDTELATAWNRDPAD